MSLQGLALVRSHTCDGAVDKSAGLTHPGQESSPNSLLLLHRRPLSKVGHVEGVAPLHLLKGLCLGLFAFKRVVVPVRVAFLSVVAVVARRN